MSLKEKLDVKIAELDEAMKAEEVDSAKIKSLNDEIEELEGSIKEAEKAAAKLAAVGKKEEDTDMVLEKATNLGENFVNTIKSKGVADRFSISAPDFVKTYSDVQKTPSTSGVSDFATTYDRNVVTAARTPLVIRDLFAAETISGSTLVYLVEGAIEGAPAVTNEGAAKPQVHFADPTPKTVSLDKVACHIKESDE